MERFHSFVTYRTLSFRASSSQCARSRSLNRRQACATNLSTSSFSLRPRWRRKISACLASVKHIKAERGALGGGGLLASSSSSSWLSRCAAETACTFSCEARIYSVIQKVQRMLESITLSSSSSSLCLFACF